MVPRQLRGLAATCGELASLHASLFLQDLLRTEIEVIRLWPPWSTILIGWFVVIAVLPLFLPALLGLLLAASLPVQLQAAPFGLPVTIRCSIKSPSLCPWAMAVARGRAVQ